MFFPAAAQASEPSPPAFSDQTGLAKLFIVEAEEPYYADIVISNKNESTLYRVDQPSGLREALSSLGYSLNEYFLQDSSNDFKMDEEIPAGSQLVLSKRSYGFSSKNIKLQPALEKVETMGLLAGETEVLTEGKPGLAIRTSSQSKDAKTVIENFTVILAPTTQKLLVGIAEENTLFHGTLLDPLDDLLPTSPYGMRVHPITHEFKIHDGEDYSAGCETPIKAAEDGTIISAEYEGGYGNRVIIDHGDGLSTGYAHMPSIEVTPGELVEAGDEIGKVGSTGYSTGCHLHFMVMIDENAVDPLPYLKSSEELLDEEE